jgi:hypothetical protein
MPIPNLWIRATAGFLSHGANILSHDSVDASGRPAIVRNVGGDVHYTMDRDRDSPLVTFLDGNLEKTVRLRIEAEFEPIRSVYFRLTGLHNSTKSDTGDTDDNEVWIGIRVGAH